MKKFDDCSDFLTKISCVIKILWIESWNCFYIIFNIFTLEEKISKNRFAGPFSLLASLSSPRTRDSVVAFRDIEHRTLCPSHTKVVDLVEINNFVPHRFGANWHFLFLITFFTIKTKTACLIKKWFRENFYIFLRWMILFQECFPCLVYFVGKIEFLIFIKTFLMNKRKDVIPIEK